MVTGDKVVVESASMSGSVWLILVCVSCLLLILEPTCTKAAVCVSVCLLCEAGLWACRPWGSYTVGLTMLLLLHRKQWLRKLVRKLAFHKLASAHKMDEAESVLFFFCLRRLLSHWSLFRLEHRHYRAQKHPKSLSKIWSQILGQRFGVIWGLFFSAPSGMNRKYPSVKTVQVKT